MILDLNDPASILAWWKVRPAHHGDFLEYKLKVSPEFAKGIWEALRRIATDPELQALLARAVGERRSRGTVTRYVGSAIPANELSYEELAEAA